MQPLEVFELAVLEEAIAQLERVVGELEPGLFEAAAAARLVELSTRLERLGSAGEALAARRVQECGTWRAEGFRSGAHWLAAKSGATAGEAEGTLRAARALDALPATAVASRSGGLSAMQAREVVETAVADPTVEAQLLATAADGSVKALRDECRRVRAVSVAGDAAWAARQHAAQRLDRWRDPDGRGTGRLEARAGARRGGGRRDRRRARSDVPQRSPGRTARTSGRVRGRRVGEPGDERARKPPQVKLTADVATIERGRVLPGERREIGGTGRSPSPSRERSSRTRA